MKRFFHYTVLVLAAILSTASMCEDEDENNDQDNKALETTLGRGSWKVTYFFDKADETNDFEGYSFLFNEDNVAIATKNALSVQGSWDTEHSSDGNTKLYLDFGTNGSLEELNEDWLVIEATSARISLEHESGGNGDTATLTLERK
ncbi:MAG TPA: hypothetical protein VF141_09795 [Chryseolinea sp.]